MRHFLLIFSCLLAFGAANAQNVDYNRVIPPANAENLTYVDKLVQVAWRNWPLNRVAHLKVDQANEQVKQARIGWLTNLNVQVQYFGQSLTNDPNTLTYVPRLGFGFALNIGNALQTPSRIREAKAQRSIREEEERYQMLFVRGEVSRRYQAYALQKELIKVVVDALEDARTTYIFAKRQFENGELPLDEYNKALATYHLAREKEKSTESAVLAAKATLEEIVGVPLEEIN